VTREPVGTRTAKFDLHFNIGERRGPDGSAQGIVGRIEYATDLFDRATVERVAGCFKRLLEAVASDPSQRLGEIEIVDPSERRLMLEEWNATSHAVPEATLPELFEAQVERTPEAVALVFEENAAQLWGAERAANVLRMF